MGRLISILIAVAILGLIWAKMADGILGPDCAARTSPTTTLGVEVSKGVAAILNKCR